MSVEDNLTLLNISFDDDGIIIEWYDERDMVDVGAEQRTSFLKMESIKNSKQLSYDLGEMVESAKALLVHWRSLR